MHRFTNRQPGDPITMPKLPGLGTGPFTIGAAGGRWLVLGFLGRLAHPPVEPALRALGARTDLFDNAFACFVGVLGPGADPGDPRALAGGAQRDGFRLVVDGDGSFTRAEGALSRDSGSAVFRPHWLICDPQLRVLDSLPMAGDDGGAGAVLARLEALPPPELQAGFPVQAPILVLPRVFEPELCAALVTAYDSAGGELSGFMREQDGKTIGVHDPRFKVRRDHLLQDQQLVDRTRERIIRRVVPEIAKAHAFHATRMERWLVACYDGSEGGHFGAHRDNTTPGTAHRRFAVSINLNDSFSGGGVSFPEYGPDAFTAPPGGAVVFSCALLHAVAPVTAGRRYAFLPFLYDEAAAEIRSRNLASLQGDAPLGGPASKAGSA